MKASSITVRDPVSACGGSAGGHKIAPSVARHSGGDGYQEDHGRPFELRSHPRPGRYTTVATWLGSRKRRWHGESSSPHVNSTDHVGPEAQAVERCQGFARRGNDGGGAERSNNSAHDAARADRSIRASKRFNERFEAETGNIKPSPEELTRHERR